MTLFPVGISIRITLAILAEIPAEKKCQFTRILISNSKASLCGQFYCRYTHREIFSKYYQIKPKSDCIYHFLNGNTDTQKNLFEILLHETEIRLYLPFSKRQSGHTEKSFRNPIRWNRNQILFTMHRLDPNQSENSGNRKIPPIEFS